jgi:hypothetical protein
LLGSGAGETRIRETFAAAGGLSGLAPDGS